MAKIFYFLGHEQFQPEVLVQHALLAEKSGFDGVFVSEHFNPWVADAGASGFAFSTLGAIAVLTKKIELMTGVVTPLFRYHPAVVAQAAATIDRLSNGRFTLGVGTGESLNETPLGYVYPSYKERAGRMKEALEIMKRLLSGEKIDFQGEYYTAHNTKLYSPPLHNISVLLAAGGPKSAGLATEYADGIITSVKSVEETKQKVTTPAQGKTPNKIQMVATRWTIFAYSEDEAYSALDAWRGLRAPDRDIAADPLVLQQEADAMPREAILSRYTRILSPQEYIDAYSPLITDLKADSVVIQTTGLDQKKIIELLGKEVVPELKKM